MGRNGTRVDSIANKWWQSAELFLPRASCSCSACLLVAYDNKTARNKRSRRYTPPSLLRPSSNHNKHYHQSLSLLSILRRSIIVHLCLFAAVTQSWVHDVITQIVVIGRQGWAAAAGMWLATIRRRRQRTTNLIPMPPDQIGFYQPDRIRSSGPNAQFDRAS